MKVEELPEQFEGVGEVKGHTFALHHRTEHGMIYVVETMDRFYYEIFEIKKSPVCLDFKKRIYSETDFKETYPKANSFGVWAWTTPDLTRAEEILEAIKRRKEMKDENERLAMQDAPATSSPG